MSEYKKFRRAILGRVHSEKSAERYGLKTGMRARKKGGIIRMEHATNLKIKRKQLQGK